VAVQFTVLGSGSSGNCAFVEAGETRVLIDAGLSGRQIRKRLLSIGRTPEKLDGILITHEHSDHVQGLIGLAATLRIPIYCNRATREAVERQLNLRLDFRLFTTGDTFEIGEVVVDTFTVPHDAYDPVGFLVRTEAGNVGFLTDLGHATRLVVERLQSANALLLESNYDLKLLQDDLRRPWSVKQRIASRHGHLSNLAAGHVLEQLLSERLRHLYLGHLSTDCNRPDLARQTAGAILEKNGAKHIRVEVASQDAPSETLRL
jgi:phosphoribosyl 1,2-cyclic phosphodiesterase